jgi:NodT family efflux transporter outer membrane factor (OMF) lipoprotein
MVGPDFKPPSPPVADGYTREKTLAPTTASPVAGGTSQSFVTGLDVGGQWWRQFGSPQIDAFVEEAVRNHPDVQSAQFALRAAREGVLQARGGLAPQVEGSLSAARQRVPAESGGIVGPALLYNLYNSSVDVSYSLDVFGGTRRSIEAREAMAEYQRFELEATYLTLTANVVTASITDASLRAQIDATREIIKSQADQLKRVQQQFEVGAVSRPDVLSQQATLAQTEAALPPLVKQRLQNRNQLMAYLGRLPGEDRGESVDLAKLRLPARLPVSVPSRLVRQRPDIRQAEAMLHEASATIGVDVANMLPQVSLTPSIGTDSLWVDDFFSPANLAWALAANVQQSIFQGGQRYYAKEAAVARFEQGYAKYKSVVINAFQNVADALRAIQQDSEALNAQAAAEAAALASLQISTGQFRAGAADYALIINAQQTYQYAVIARIQAQASRYADTVALYQALGGGWWNRTDETADSLPRKGGLLEGPSGPGLDATVSGKPTGLLPGASPFNDVSGGSRQP